MGFGGGVSTWSCLHSSSRCAAAPDVRMTQPGMEVGVGGVEIQVHGGGWGGSKVLSNCQRLLPFPCSPSPRACAAGGAVVAAGRVPKCADGERRG